MPLLQRVEILDQGPYGLLAALDLNRLLRDQAFLGTQRKGCQQHESQSQRQDAFHVNALLQDSGSRSFRGMGSIARRAALARRACPSTSRQSAAFAEDRPADPYHGCALRNGELEIIG